MKGAEPSARSPIPRRAVPMFGEGELTYRIKSLSSLVRFLIGQAFEHPVSGIDFIRYGDGPFSAQNPNRPCRDLLEDDGSLLVSEGLQLSLGPWDRDLGRARRLFGRFDHVFIVFQPKALIFVAGMSELVCVAGSQPINP